jgi:hypothetical protein
MNVCKWNEWEWGSANQEGKYGFRLADAALRRDSHGMNPTWFCERPTFHEPIAARANGCRQSEIRPYM